MLSALLGGVAPLLGAGISGYFNQQGARANAAAQEAINQQNIQFATKQASGQFLGNYYSNLVSAATGAGLSPLALLGGNPTSGASANLVAPQPGAGMQQTGQDVSRAMLSVGDNLMKQQELELQAKRLQVAGMQNDVVAGQMRNSVNARALASPGSPPTWAAGSQGSPFFGPINPFGGPHPDLIRTSSGDVERSREQAEIAFSGDPWMMAKQSVKSLGRDIDAWYQPWISGLRDDIRRNVQGFSLENIGVP